MCMFKVRYIRPISSLKLGMQSLDNRFSIRVLHFIKKSTVYPSVIHGKLLYTSPKILHLLFLLPGLALCFRIPFLVNQIKRLL